jgi:hypothetical protein
MSTGAGKILELLGPSCHDQVRRDLLLKVQQLNGIDYVEFEIAAGPPTRYVLHVHFLLDLPNDAYGLITDLSKLSVLGGSRITRIAVTKATRASQNILDVEVDAQGDYSPYLFAIGWTRGESAARLDEDGTWRWDEGSWTYDFAAIDRPFSVAPVNFRPGCAVDFDCAPGQDCPPDLLPEPALDYLARDYASFRQLLIDLVAQRKPSWTERSAADIGIALIELFAYEGDYISYYQDAAANEAYLDTARQRISAKRHARLVDYHMHDGRNASTFVHFNVNTAGTIPPGQQLLTSITAPFRHDVDPPETLLKPLTNDDYLGDPALAQVRVFETSDPAVCDPLNNTIEIHAWGNEQCCLPRGTRTAHLYAVDANRVAVTPKLKAGDYLLLEEVCGPKNGAAADKDPSHRQVVRLTRVSTQPLFDPLFLASVDPAGDLVPVTPGAPPPPIPGPLPLLEVTWGAADALAFPLCVSARREDLSSIHRISRARGNLVRADHGRTVEESLAFDPAAADPAIRLTMAQGPITMQAPPRGDVRAAAPAIALTVWHDTQASTWLPTPSLLPHTEFDRRFVVDMDNAGRAVLRFGDGVYGQRFTGVSGVKASYRVGNGVAGNIGAEALSHLVLPRARTGWPEIVSLRNPLPAEGGVDPESIEEVRQYAPAAFRASQHRAVTEDDYRKAALTIDGVAGAAAAFRWTGSWYTVFVAIDPSDPANLLTNERGVTSLAPAFKMHVHDGLDSYRLAGYDLEIRSARYVPLDITVHVCAKPGFFSGDVAHAVATALGAFFDAKNLTFGQPVYLSALYAAIEAVEGVESATVTGFHPYGRDPGDELSTGVIPVGPWEIARLDNDRSNMENGTLNISAGDMS